MKNMLFENKFVFNVKVLPFTIESNIKKLKKKWRSKLLRFFPFITFVTS